MKNFLEFHEIIKNETNKQVRYLNYGGCGFYAYFMSKKLTMLGFKPEILVLTSGEENIDDKYSILKQIKNNQKLEVPSNTLSSSHFVVKCENYVFDSDEIIDLENKPLQKGEILFWRRYIGTYTIEDMAIALYRDRAGWNDWYDRLECNGLLYNIIKETPLILH